MVQAYVHESRLKKAKLEREQKEAGWLINKGANEVIVDK